MPRNQLEHPEVFTLRDASGTPTHVVLSWDAETARHLGIDEPKRKDGRILTTFRLEEDIPDPIRRRRAELAGRN